MIYLYIVGYFLIALLLNAFARASYSKHGTKSWVYKCELIYGQNYFMINLLSFCWPIAIFGIGSLSIVTKLLFPVLGKLFNLVVNPLIKMFLYLMDDSSKDTKLQNKKDNTPTTF